MPDFSHNIHPDVDAKIPHDECGNAFREEMKGRQYGYDPSLSAWGWFESGWKAREAAKRIERRGG